MNKIQRHLWFLLAVVFAVCLTIFALSYIVTEPWHILPAIGGDAAKNNFTYLYQSMYGKGYWFEGMNYPYGEHIVYTDGQPLLSVLFASIGNVSTSTALTICWELLGLSYVLSMVYVYKTLAYFRVGPLPAIIFACLIGITTPQIICIRGHYALAYTCIVPMIFYWNVLYHETGKLRYCLWFFILGCLVSFLHPYYAGMMLVWAASYAIGYFIFTKNKPAPKLKHITPLLAGVVAVVLVVAITMKLTDPTKDRPVTPFNPPESYTHIKQIITSDYSPIWHRVTEMKLIWKASDGGEGFTYPGLVTLITVAIFTVCAVLKKIRKKDRTINTSSSGFSLVWLFIAFAVLAFSMGIPFIWHMQWLMKYISIFRQFRALGRFSCIFYYIITVYSVVVIYARYTQLVAKSKKKIGYILLVGSVVLWSYEASGYIKMTRELSRQAAYNYDVIFSRLEQNWTSYLEDHHFTKNDFQAILALKFFHIGSEKLWVGDGAWTITLASRAALQLHLPIIDVMMSRSSWGDTKKQVRIAGGPYTDKPILRDIKSNKPFLLLYFEEDSLDVDQKYLLTASDYIGHYSQCHIYACYPDRLAANDKKHADEINALLPALHIGDTCVRGVGSWYVDHYDDKQAKEHLFGTGANTAIKANDSTIAVIPVKPVGDSQLYELSAWFLLGSQDYSSPYIDLELTDSAGHIIGRTTMNTKESVDNYNMWFRANVYFSVRSDCRSVKCKLNNTPNPAYFAMDELMLRPADALIISKAASGMIMVNNHLFNAVKR